jgi:nucleotide-binding universal stress UspA family protein
VTAPSSIPTRYLSKILVAVDGSENANRAVEAAVRLCLQFQSKLVILNAVVIDEYGMRHGQYTEEDSVRVLEDALSFAKLKLAAEGGNQIPVTTLSKHANSIVETIVQSASDERADLIVIGTRGLGGFKRLLLGSVSSGVVTHARCNVLVVR